MAIQLLRAVNNYIGLSSDSKPTTDIDIGSTFTESDTSEVYVFDGTGWFIREGRIDQSTASLMVVDYAHHEIHSGSSFLMNDVFTLAINAVVDIRITTPNTAKWAHFVMEFDTSSEFEFYFYETAVISTVGTAFTPINRNRNSATASVVSIDYITNTSLALANADTDVTGATTIIHGISGSGRTEGGSASTRHEIILKQNKIYCFRAIANAAGWIHGEFNWYEHTARN